jgi:hypothetical protein
VAGALGLAVLVLLIRKHAADLYPYATKRFLPFGVPLAALLAGGWLESAAPGRRRGLLLALAALCALLVLPKSLTARRAVEYRGVVQAIEELAQHLAPGDLVVADHFWYGTPLMCWNGFQVLNGERIWSSGDGERAKAAAAFLAAQQARGKRIRWVTSTERGMAVYPPPLTATNRLWSSPPFEFREIAHHRNARGFELRTIRHEWCVWE